MKWLLLSLLFSLLLWTENKNVWILYCIQGKLRGRQTRLQGWCLQTAIKTPWKITQYFGQKNKKTKGWYNSDALFHYWWLISSFFQVTPSFYVLIILVFFFLSIVGNNWWVHFLSLHNKFPPNLAPYYNSKFILSSFCESGIQDQLAWWFSWACCQVVNLKTRVVSRFCWG